ncbi:hypothetical protein [Acinetobacter sp. GXMZU3951]
MGISIFCLILGFIIGYLFRDSRKEVHATNTKPKSNTRNVYLSYNERQRAKLQHYSDADRIRELNLLSPNESKFMRLLQHQFLNELLIIKDHRFYIADQDRYPIAIFEYRDGSKELKVQDVEDGIPVFIYKAILSSEAIADDHVFIKNRSSAIQ